ncbi:hypothetical protein PRUPE_6G145400 [Prunus persica]|uniref:Uncharacterized protein n=1 Tax=Prunus persica TaxID=3760 RepID=M5W411_PRUPE|nr:hypothetical protein PRUPE_6G145400 [Prunus persica]
MHKVFHGFQKGIRGCVLCSCSCGGGNSGFVCKVVVWVVGVGFVVTILPLNLTNLTAVSTLTKMKLKNYNSFLRI